jgi:Domain of unknown function (DUF362)
MNARNRENEFDRREFLAASAGLGGLGAVKRPTRDHPASTRPADGIPGRFPGRVVEVRECTEVEADACLDRGIQRLTSAPSSTVAWRSLFQPGDVVGVFANLEGNPASARSQRLLSLIVSKVVSAGVSPSNVRIYSELAHDDDEYDIEQFVRLDLIQTGRDVGNERNYRSHLRRFLTRKVDKIVHLATLSDHMAAGLGGCLQSMAHGLVDNWGRSQCAPSANVSNQFIPQVVNHPTIRAKCVLQIMDALVATYQGGRFGSTCASNWTWDANRLLLATDPVALDMVALGILDEQRGRMGLPQVGACGLLGRDSEFEMFDMRQPQHIFLAGQIGLGAADRKQIEHIRIDMNEAGPGYESRPRIANLRLDGDHPQDAQAGIATGT